MSRKKNILLTVEDLIKDFLYYDRKEDEDLMRGEIEDAIAKGEISADDIKDQFCRSLDKGLSA